MRKIETGFDGLFVLEMDLKRDDRGYFARTFCEDAFAALGLVARYPQSGTAWNARAGTVRGMHFQRAPHGEVKLIRCTRGAIADIVVDVREGSPTYLKAYEVELTPDNGRQFYVPEGFAHGYQTLADDTEVLYLMSTVQVPEAATGIRWDDPAVAVRWPKPISIISPRDQAWPLIGADGRS